MGTPCSCYASPEEALASRLVQAKVVKKVSVPGYQPCALDAAHLWLFFLVAAKPMVSGVKEAKALLGELC